MVRCKYPQKEGRGGEERRRGRWGTIEPTIHVPRILSNNAESVFCMRGVLTYNGKFVSVHGNEE